MKKGCQALFHYGMIWRSYIMNFGLFLPPSLLSFRVL
nr:MAG TPA: hypothetical protein [Caudoviricetes sp.]DAV06582.1 MAG TPA: hypothetical protein [Caudoviricetes sp.]